MNNISHSVEDHMMSKEVLPVYSIQVILNSNNIEEHISSTVRSNIESVYKDYISVCDSREDYDGIFDHDLHEKYCDPYNGKVYNWNFLSKYVFTCIEDNHSSPKMFHFYSSDSRIGYSEFVNFLFGSLKKFEHFKNDFVMIEKITTDYLLSRPFHSYLSFLESLACAKHDMM